MDIDSVLSNLDKGGVVALLVMMIFAFLVGLHREWWYPGRYVKRLLDERDRHIVKLEGDVKQWMNHALKGTDLADRSVGSLEEVMSAGKILAQLEEAAKRGKG